MLSSRLATLTVSPKVVNSSRSAMPTLPWMTGPKWMPMPTVVATLPTAMSWSRHWSIVSRISMAQSSASRASSGAFSGAPNTAIRPSPRNLSTEPLWRKTMGTMRRWKARMMVMTSSGVIASMRRVEPMTSTNITAASWARPASRPRTSAASRSTTLGEK